ncbi:MAG: nitrous oxide reductase accessory protein NosL [Cyclobacteriaceae bacterium]|nr:nitrous oxide reductase accessory protein NosL [Cyclobacteriaceae bacterium]
MKNTPLFFILFSLFFSCSVELEKINYGKEACHFCKMTIVDQQHAAEAVTTKGKVFKYDAVECMINDLKQKKEVEMALLFVNDYSTPGKLIDVQTTTFLISEKIKSPMGANLSAFGSNEEAQKMVDTSGGSLYNWEEVQSQLK